MVGRIVVALVFNPLMIAGIFAFAAASARADEVSVRAAPHDGYGRIVFNWPAPVGHTARIAAGRLTVRFARPITTSFDIVSGVLGEYVADPRIAGDGQTVSFALKGSYDLRNFDAGSAVVVDLVKKAPPRATKTRNRAPGAPVQSTQVSRQRAGKAAAQSTASGDLPKVRVRTGEHPTYTRLVFDWPQQVAYSVEKSGGVATIVFRRPADIGLDRVAKRPPPFVGGARARVDGDTVTVVLSVAESSTLRHFLSGAKVVVDVNAPTGNDQAGPLPAEAQPNPPQEKPAEKPQEKLPEKTVEATKEAKAAPDAAPAPKPAPTPAPVSAPELVPPPSAPIETAAPALGVPQGLTPGATLNAAVAETPVSTSVSPAATPSATAGQGQPGVAVKVETVNGGTQLRFDWTEPVAAAVFRRGQGIWIAFDKPRQFDTGLLLQQASPAISAVTQVASSSGSVLRLVAGRGINPAVQRNGFAWIVDLRRQAMAAQTPINAKAQPNSPVGARVFLPVPEPGDPIAVTDPEIGDNLVVVPTVPLGHGIAQAYIYPQFEILTSAQGVAVQPLIDDLRVRGVRQGVELSSANSLAISSVSADAEANSRLAANRPLQRIIPLDVLEKEEMKNGVQFVSRRQDLENKLAKARTAAARLAGRLDLARFYFANAYASELIAVLRVMAEDAPESEEEAEFRLLRGAAEFMLARHDKAAVDLDHDSLVTSDEGAFWRAANVAATGDMLGAARDLQLMGAIARPYPKPLRYPLGILVTRTVIEVGDSRMAENFIEALNLDKPSRADQAGIAFVQGKLEELNGNFDAAVGTWEEIPETAPRPVRAHALVARTELLLKLRRMELSEAIDEYEKLRFAWRGGEFEFNMLRRLGGLYLDEGRFREGLATLKNAATFFRDHPDAAQVTQQMADVFNGLYLDDGSLRLPPVAAIALYNDFKELTPAGSDGDRMIQKLADRLVEVDLLDRASDLLQAQVRFRLNGVDKARVGARLALIHILAERFTDSLESLDGTNTPGQPDELQAQRRHLRARALMGIERPGEALDLLARDDSRNAELLRAEIFWDAQDWGHASQSFGRLLRSSGAKPGEALDSRQAATVLNYAVSLTLSGGEKAAERLRRDYGIAMAESKLADAFTLVTSPSAPGLLDPGQVAGKVEEAESFVTAYRDKLKEGRPLSSIN